MQQQRRNKTIGMILSVNVRESAPTSVVALHALSCAASRFNFFFNLKTNAKSTVFLFDRFVEYDDPVNHSE